MSLFSRQKNFVWWYILRVFNILFQSYFLNTLGTGYNEEIHAKKTTPCRGVLVLTKLVKISVNYFHAKKSCHSTQLLVVTQLVVSGTQCNTCFFHFIQYFHFLFQFLYNGAGEFVNPLVIHDGLITEVEQKMFGPSIYFMQTENGTNFSSLCTLIKLASV